MTVPLLGEKDCLRGHGVTQSGWGKYFRCGFMGWCLLEELQSNNMLN